MPPSQKRTILILFAAFVAAAGINSVLVVLLASNSVSSRPTDLHTIEPVIYVAAAGALAAAMYVAMARMPGAEGIGQFQSLMIVSLALAHACTIFGLLLFFLGRRPEMFWPFPVLTILTELLIILPRVLRRVQA